MAKKIGYIRLVNENELDVQDPLMKDFINTCDLIFKEDISQSRSTVSERNDMISRLIKGDVVVIKNLLSATTSLKDLLEFIQLVHDKGACIYSLEDAWLNSTKQNKCNEYFLEIIKHLYQFENEVHLLRIQSGIVNAKSKGTKFGRPPKDENKIKEALELYQSGKYTGSEICKRTSISRRTLYNYINKYGIK